MSDFKAIIYDCDGTLVDTEYLNNLATQEVLAEEGFVFDMDYMNTHFYGLRFQDCLKHISQSSGHVFDDAIRKRYVARCASLMEEHFRPIDGAIELVQDTAARYQICVASNGQLDNIIRSLKTGGLYALFAPEYIFNALMVEKPKPAPDLFLFAAEKLGVAPQDCLVIEDSPVGVQAGVAAGMTTWGFTGAHHDPDTARTMLENAGAQRVFHALIHIQEALNN